MQIYFFLTFVILSLSLLISEADNQSLKFPSKSLIHTFLNSFMAISIPPLQKIITKYVQFQLQIPNGKSSFFFVSP